MQHLKQVLFIGIISFLMNACQTPSDNNPNKTTTDPEELRDKAAFLPDLKSELEQDQSKGTLVFTFSAIAHAKQMPNGVRIPTKGMQILANLTHKYGIPVTWLTDATTAKLMQKEINQWHEEFGDDVAMISGTAVQRDSLKILFPWSAVNVMSSRHTEKETAIAQSLGVKGIWGSCWEQEGVDGITDRGAPWGLYYTSAENYKVPALSGKGPVSLEWTSRDLLKALHSGRASIYSSDPNDVLRSKICSPDDISYLKAMFNNYIRNIRHNKFVFFQQQQESHEMQYDGVLFKVYPQDVIDESIAVLDQFFAYVKTYGDLVKYKTLPEAIALYEENFAETEPALMLVDDFKINPIPFWYGRENGVTGPWPQTLLYYDKAGQFAFVKDRFDPILLRDYVHNRSFIDPAYYQVPYVDHPNLKVEVPWEDIPLDEVLIRVEAPKAIPYAVAFWYDLKNYRITNVDGAQVMGIAEDQVALLRLDLKKGRNDIVVHLEPKKRG